MGKRAPATFKQRDVTAAINGAHKAGFSVRRVEIDKSGKIALCTVAEDSGELWPTEREARPDERAAESGGLKGWDDA